MYIYNSKSIQINSWCVQTILYYIKISYLINQIFRARGNVRLGEKTKSEIFKKNITACSLEMTIQKKNPPFPRLHDEKHWIKLKSHLLKLFYGWPESPEGAVLLRMSTVWLAVAAVIEPGVCAAELSTAAGVVWLECVVVIGCAVVPTVDVVAVDVLVATWLTAVDVWVVAEERTTDNKRLKRVEVKRWLATAAADGRISRCWVVFRNRNCWNWACCNITGSS